VTQRSDVGQTKNIMNKKLITLVAVAVIAAIFLLWAVGRFMDWLVPTGQLHDLVSGTINVVATLVALPVRLYAYFIYGDHGSWSLPVLIFLLALSGLMWGIIVERIDWVFSRRNTAQ